VNLIEPIQKIGNFKKQEFQMHIEPGLVNGVKVIAANGAASGVLLAYGSKFFKQIPTMLIRTTLASVFFTVFMQAFHMNVGPSELHFVGAMAIYMTLGFIPTLYGFALGLLFQGLLFAPWDLPHLAVNSLSLMVPLIVVHYTRGQVALAKGVSNISWKDLVKLDAMYYSGVALMVGFWLLGESATTFAAWGQFALSYMAVVALEPVVTLTAVFGLRQYGDNAVMRKCFALENFAAAS
jgi:ABC-type Co2+ transport system permease subunit